MNTFRHMLSVDRYKDIELTEKTTYEPETKITGMFWLSHDTSHDVNVK